MWPVSHWKANTFVQRSKASTASYHGECYERMARGSNVLGLIGLGQIVFVTDIGERERRYWGMVEPVLNEALQITGRCWMVLSEKWREQYAMQSGVAAFLASESGKSRVCKEIKALQKMAAMVPDLEATLSATQAVADRVPELEATLKATQAVAALVPDLQASLASSARALVSATKSLQDARTEIRLNRTRYITLAVLVVGVFASLSVLALFRADEERLLRETRQTGSTLQCTICMDRSISRRIESCGHCFCHVCAKEAQRRRQCHLCRSMVLSVQVLLV